MKKNTLRRVFAILLLIFAVVLALALYAVSNLRRSEASSDWVNHTHAVIVENEGVLSSLNAGEAALRTFLLTGDPRDWGTAREAFGVMDEHMEVAKALTRQEPRAAEELARIEQLIGARETFAGKLATARRANQAEAVQSLLASDAGSGAVNAIRRAVQKLTNDQMALLAERDRASFIQAQRMRWIVWTGVAVNMLLFIAVAWLIRDDLAARDRLAETLRQSNEDLEAKVRERTSELAGANQSLQDENLERRWSQQALEHQLRYNQLIVDSVRDPVIVLTKALHITRVNPAVLHLTAFDPQDLVGKPLSVVLEWNAEGGVDPVMRSLRDGRELSAHAASVIDRQRLRHPVKFSVVPLRDRDKVVGGVMVLQLNG